jgi:hypothetical protein
MAFFHSNSLSEIVNQPVDAAAIRLTQLSHGGG